MGKSSKDKRDLYYRKAKEEGYRARSAFKLLQLNDQFQLFKNVNRVVDLCAAPGSWSQVLSSHLTETAKIVSVDLQPMSPINNVTTLQADITHPATLNKILDIFGGEPADLVVSDGAPDVTGLHDLDEYIQQQLILSALQLTTCMLREGGAFVAKIFRGRDIDLMYSQLGYLFERVVCAKPRSSRGTSLESFIVCLGYKKPANWEPKLDINLSIEDFFKGCDIGRLSLTEELVYVEEERDIVEFMSCGGLDSFDSDATYTEVGEVALEPVQGPTNPPYKKALELKRMGKLAAK